MYFWTRSPSPRRSASLLTLALAIAPLALTACPESTPLPATHPPPPLGPADPSATPSASPPAPKAPLAALSTQASASSSAAPSAAPSTAPSAAPSAPLLVASADPSSPPVRPYTSWRPDELPPLERAANAIATRTPIVKELYAKAGVAFPPAALFFRAFKSDRQLEVWAASSKDEPLKHVTTYGICRISGDIGPKRAEGDAQVPEGFYTIHYLWPNSNYHLEMKVGYPNASDRILGGKTPGGDIMIHGACASIGCLSMSDERIEELWTMVDPVIKRGAKVHVHIFPARDMKALLADKEQAKHWAFWANLKEGFDAFERDKRLPNVGVDWKGRYTFEPSQPQAQAQPHAPIRSN